MVSEDLSIIKKSGFFSSQLIEVYNENLDVIYWNSVLF